MLDAKTVVTALIGGLGLAVPIIIFFVRTYGAIQRDIGERVTRDHFDKKIDGLSEKFDGKIEGLSAKLDDKIEGIRVEFDKLPKKEHLDSKFDALTSEMRLEIERALGRRSSAEESGARGGSAG